MVQKKMIESTTQMPTPTKEMYVRTILLVFSWLILGICSEIIGPTMSVLAYNNNITFNGIATALAAGSAASLLTNICCGIFQNVVDKYQDLILAMAFFLRAILASLTPFIHSLLLLCIVFAFQGVVGSSANLSGSNLIFKMWKSHAAAPLNMVHFGYGFGAIVANLIVRPFLRNRNPSVNTTVSSTINSTLSTSVSEPIDADIRPPYLIAAGLCLIISVGHLVFFIRERNDNQNKVKKPQIDYTPVKTDCSKTETHSNEIKHSQYSPATCGRGSFSYGLSLSILFIIYIFFVTGIDQTFAKFYFSYLKFDKFNISANSASLGIIFFWLSFSISRLIGAIGSVFIPVYICLIITWCAGLAVAIMWMIYVWIIGLTMTSLFVLGSLTGFIIGPLFPLSFAWFNQKLNVIPALLAALFCACGIGATVLQKIGGFVMDRNPDHFPTLITASIVLTIVLYIVANIIIFVHERKLRNKQYPTIHIVSLTTEKFSEEEKEEEQQNKQMTNYLQGVNETE